MIQQGHQVEMCFSYLVTAGVEFYRQEKRIENHVARLDVDWRLSLSNRAQVPSGVHQTPEGWHCNTKETADVICMDKIGTCSPIAFDFNHTLKLFI